MSVYIGSKQLERLSRMSLVSKSASPQLSGHGCAYGLGHSVVSARDMLDAFHVGSSCRWEKDWGEVAFQP